MKMIRSLALAAAIVASLASAASGDPTATVAPTPDDPGTGDTAPAPLFLGAPSQFTVTLGAAFPAGGTDGRDASAMPAVTLGWSARLSQHVWLDLGVGYAGADLDGPDLHAFEIGDEHVDLVPFLAGISFDVSRTGPDPWARAMVGLGLVFEYLRWEAPPEFAGDLHDDRFVQGAYLELRQEIRIRDRWRLVIRERVENAATLEIEGRPDRFNPDTGLVQIGISREVG